MSRRSGGGILPRAFYARDTLTVARALIGKVLVHATPSGATAGSIVEVEAYIGESDPACHASSGFTPRNAPLYGPPGQAYVYLNYGMHFLVNAVTEPEGAPGAVLLCALEPLEGVDLMWRRRARPSQAPRSRVTHLDLCRGPGNLSRALGISLSENRMDLTGDRLFVMDRGLESGPVAWSRRVGIRVGTDRQWRCFLASSPCVSRQ